MLEHTRRKFLAWRTILLVLGISFVTWSCRSTPITGRKQLLIVPESQEIAQGLAAFQEVVSKEPESKNSKYVALVTRVGERIAAVADRSDYQWEFRVIASPIQNAFCLPGGKVAVYEGIIPVCKNEAGLAVVMSHEVSHALARHGGERMSHQRIATGLQKAVTYATQDRAQIEQKIILAAYGVTAKYGAILPYSRAHEMEADSMGLLLMAKAGYDPREAPLFWERFAQSKQGDSLPQFLSTHPSDEHRAENLRQSLPQALALYEAAPVQYGLGETIE